MGKEAEERVRGAMGEELAPSLLIFKREEGATSQGMLGRPLDARKAKIQVPLESLQEEHSPGTP